MLTDDQVSQVWDEMIAAEVRSLYFADLGAKFTRHKQLISAISFFLSSGAAATLIGKAPVWVPVLLSVITAIATAYSMAIGLDKKASTMAKLHYTWSQIESNYRRLWNHWYEDDAEDILRLQSREASQLAVTDAPYETDRVKKWRAFVHQEHGIAPA